MMNSEEKNANKKFMIVRTKEPQDKSPRRKLKDIKAFKWTIIPICIVLCFIGKFIPPVGLLTTEAFQVLFIFLGCLILWLTIGIDWPSLLCIFALGFVDSLGFKTVLANSFGNSTFLFLLFTFVCTYALSKTSIIKRVTLFFINSKLAKKSGLWFSFLFLFSVLVVGLFVSPSVLFVVILAILKEILKMARIDKGEKIGKALMMGLGFTVSISSGMTPIAHVFPVLAMEAAGVSINAGSYMLFAIPIGLVLFLLMFLVLFIFYKPDTSKLKSVDTSSLRAELPKINKADIITLLTFIVVIILWIIPDFFKDIAPDFYNVMSGFTTAMPPILGTIVLCVVKVEGKPILKIDEALKNIPWGSLMMCAATLVLGVALTNNDVGLKQFLQVTLSGSLTNVAPIALLIIFGIWAAIQTNLSSNMVTATLVATVAASVLTSINSTLSLEVVACIIGFLASCAFATPPSMPHIAIIAASDYSNVKDVLLFGSILMVFSVIAALAIGYPLGLLVF